MAIPKCPLGHRRSAVVRAGWYGGGTSGQQRRQRWKCTPKTGQPHRFAETLPRVAEAAAERHVCGECATTLKPWEGQPAPRLYGFTARDIAKALVMVAGGSTYRAASAVIRTQAGRQLSTTVGRSRTGKPLAPANSHGQLVSDWVDTFAPVIWAAYAPQEWPRAVVLDEGNFRYSTSTPGPGAHAFAVLAAVGYDAQGRRYVARLEAVRRANTQAWSGFLRRMKGTPQHVVTDGGIPQKAAAAVWPLPGDAAPTLYRCEWHLGRNILDVLPADVRRDPDDQLPGLLNRCQDSLANWQALLNELNARAATGRCVTALNRAKKIDPLVRHQLATRSHLLPRSTGPVEQFFRVLNSALRDRAGRMTNKKRADALLMLLAAQHNGWVNEREWAELIRKYLTRRRGLAPEQRRHTDPAAKPSLR